MTVDEVFAHNTANYRFCGFEILPTFSCYDVVKAPDIEGDMVRLRTHDRSGLLTETLPTLVDA